MKQRFLIGLVVIFGLLGARAAFSGPVTDLEASNDDGLIELSWTEPTDVATASTYAYAVQRSSSGSVPWIDISDSLPEGSTEYTDVNTINNETWYYRVAAWTDSDTAYSNIVFETAYYPQRISGLTASPTFICYETNGSPDSSAITFNLYAGPGASAAKKVTITLLEAGGEIGTITIYEPASGIHTVYWDGSWGDMAATSIGANTWVAAMGTGDDWIKHNGTYGMEARATNYNDDESDVAGTGTSIGVNVVHIQRPVTIEHTVIGNNPPAYVPPYKVTYQLTKEAYVTIRIYKETATGGLGTLVRRIEEDVPRPGEQAERNLTNTQFWDGKNDTGLIVPNGKYIMTLEAHEASGCETPPEDYADTVEIVWAVDVLRLTDWDEVHITPTNPTGSISYTLSHDANCTIAIYPEGTQFTDDFPNTDPVIILVGGGPREAGSHTEEWVGLDSDGLLVPNAVYTYTISAELHGVKAVDYVGNDCPFYGTIVVNREEHEIESPTNLTATNADGVIQLSWTAPTNNIGDVTYSLYRGVNASVSPSSYSDSHPGLTSTKFSDTGTVDGTVYYYVVTAIDSAKPTDESDPSNLASAQAVYPKPPTIPGNLTTETIARKIKLTWDASQVTGGSQGSVFYRIYRSQTSPVEINDTNRIATQILTTKYTDNVSTGSYYYRVTAVDDSSMIESASSNEVLAISYFLPPEGLSAANKDGIITLTWTETKGISLVTYNIYRGTSSTSLTKVDSGVIETKWQDLDTANGVNYYYIATATDSFDNLESDPSNKVAERAIYPIDLLSVSISTNVAGIEYETNGQPDSVTITFTINAGDSDSKGNPSRVEKAVISITDHISGQEVAAFELENLPSGTYSDTWDGTWDVPGQWIKHNGSYTITGTITNYDGASPLPGVSGVYVDVVHIQQPVEIEYTTEGQNPPVLGPQYHITYQLTKSAYVIHKIYTDTGVLVRTISSDVPRMGEGFDRDITVTDYWDLRATNGSFVPNGIYHWQITAYYQGDTSTVTFDLPVQPLRLTDLTTVGIAQSEDKAQIIYTLTTDATVTIKIYAPGTTFTGGLDDNGNPIPEDASALVKTLTFSRGKGSHTESWDGTNDTGQVVANDIYMMSIIALDSHRNRAVDYNGSECPFYGTIPVYRGITPPTLSWTGETGYASDGVNPDKDKAGDTFTYRISYAHQDNTPLLAPPTLHIFKGGTEIDTELMTGVDPYDQTYSDSKLYTVDVSLTDTGADYSYYFEARDINGIPATGIPTRSIVGYMKNGPIVDNTPLVTINQIDRGGFPEIDCYVTVTDQAGDHLDGLDADSFTVTEGGGGFNGTPDTVGSPTAALSTALVMDYSGSMGDADVVNAEAAANIFVNNMADTDRAAVVKFDETVSLIRGFTSNKGLLRNAISTPYSRGATAFYDAVYLGLEETAKQQGRKAIVAFTDGLDNSSTHTVGEVVTYAKNNSIPIFTIGLGEANEQVLTSMAQGTGGQFYSAPTSAELITIFEEISTALSNQYLVSYNTNRDTPDGQIRDVTIGVCYLGKCEEDGTTYQSPADTSPPAGAPDTPSWSAGEFSNSTDITCAWDLGNAQDTGSDIVGYYLQVGADPTTFTYQMVFDDRVGNVKSYKIENLTEGRTYYARVRAENGSGLYSNWSGISKGIRIVTTLTNLTVSSPNIEPLSGLPLLASEGDSIAISFESFKGAFKEVVVTITDVIKKEEAAVLKVYDLPSHGDTITTIYWNGIWTEGGGWHKHNSCYSVAVEAIEYGDTSTVIAGGLFCVDVVHIQLPVLIEYTTSGEKPPVIVPSYKLTYQLTKDAYVTHSVYTDTGLLVRTIESNTPRIGEWLDRDQKNVAFWDMRSHDGSLVPNGIYYWEIMATDGEDTSVPVYVRVPVQPLRLTDLSAVGISEDGGEGGGNEAQINYTMTASAAVTIKIYEPGTKFTGALDTAGNPVSSDTTALVRTLGPFSRGEGSYSEIWNGRDNDGHLVDNGIYIYSITATDAHGNRAVDLAGNDAPFFGDIPVQQSAEEEEPEEPEFSETTVYAYPNPVMVSRGDVVTFRYALSEAADVTIKVYTITGEILWEKEILNQSAGIYKNENWDVRNKGGKSVASGLYIYSVQKNDDKPIIKKLIVIR